MEERGRRPGDGYRFASELVDDNASDNEFCPIHEGLGIGFGSRSMSLTKASPEELISGQRHRWFYVACAAEASLVPVAAILGYFFVTRLGPCRWNWIDPLVGLVAGLPPFVLFSGC